MKLSDALIHALASLGVRHVFGVSGANIEHLHDAIHRAGPQRIQSVLAKTETGAAFMADAQARVHGTLGVCCATSGGGMMNLAVGIAESFQASVPVLAIVGQTPSVLDGTGAFQESTGIGRSVDALALMGSISTFAARLDAPQRFWATLHDALRSCFGTRPGPAVLLVPREAFDAEVDAMPDWFPRSLQELASPHSADPLALQALVQALRRARRPAVVVGPFAAASAGSGALRRFCEALQIPVFTTMEAASAFPQDHPLFAGLIGAAGHPSAHACLNDEIDRVVVVGSDLGTMVRSSIGRGLRRARVVIVHPEPDQALRALPEALRVSGDVEAIFQRLLEEHRLEPFPSGHPIPEISRYAARLVDPHDPPADELLQSEAIAVLDSHLPRGSHLLFDAGNCAAAALHGLHLGGVESATIALGMGGMGYSVAAAVGTQLLARPGETTTVVLGDGAFLMLGLEVHTAVELGLPILFVVFNNAAHGMCVTRQDLFFSGRHEATRYGRVSVVTAARALGGCERLWVGHARSRAEMEQRLAEYRAQSPRPGVLELELLREEMPPFAPFLAADASTIPARTDPISLNAA